MPERLFEHRPRDNYPPVVDFETTDLGPLFGMQLSINLDELVNEIQNLFFVERMVNWVKALTDCSLQNDELVLDAGCITVHDRCDGDGGIL